MTRQFITFTILFVMLHYFSRAQVKETQIEIQPVFRDQLLNLSTTSYVTAKGDTVSFDRLRFYLSHFELTFENGQKYIEQNSYHLIDAEDPSSLHINLKNVPPQNIKTISFNVGVDSVASVSGAMSGPLDPVKGMYWAWNSGYINAKMEGNCKTGKKNHVFEFHIGGYMQPFYAIRSAKLEIPSNSKSSKILLLADASVWLEGLDLKKENSVLIPGKAAMEIADNYAKMFRLQL